MTTLTKAELKKALAMLTPIAKAVTQIPADAREVVHIYPYGIEVKTADLRKINEVLATLSEAVSK
jgi:pyrroline-5-carboxylate reductase